MSKVIFISDSLADIESVTAFVKNNQYEVEYYSHEEWRQHANEDATLSSNESKGEHSKTNMIPFSPVKNTAFNSMEDIKINAIKKALIVSHGNASKAAGMLKIGRATLYRKVKQLGLDLESLRKSSTEQVRQPALKKSA